MSEKFTNSWSTVSWENTWFNIECNFNTKGNIQIFDLQGNMILQQSLIQNSNKINISSLSKGTYILQLINEGFTENFKFIKD